MTQQPPPIRTARIIHLALVLGLVTITALFVFLRLNHPPDTQPQVTNVLLIVVMVMFSSYFTVRPFLGKALLAKIAADRDGALAIVREERVPLPLYSLSIVGAALAEGPGLLGAMLVYLGAPWYALAAPVLSIALILMSLPTREKLEEQIRSVAR